MRDSYDLEDAWIHYHYDSGIEEDFNIRNEEEEDKGNKSGRTTIVMGREMIR